MQFYGSNREDWMFVLPPGVQGFVLDPDNVWYGRIKLLFLISVKSDVSEEVIKIDCAYVSFCYDIKLEESGNAVNVCNVY
jgi:hypothetical protein